MPGHDNGGDNPDINPIIIGRKNAALIGVYAQFRMLLALITPVDRKPVRDLRCWRRPAENAVLTANA